MGRRRKPGVPGKTTIPAEVVKATSRCLRAVYARHGDKEHWDFFVVPQQGFLYVEIDRRPEPGTYPVAVKSSTTRKPLGRLRYVPAGKWIYEPYRWSDECWDTREVEYGSAEDLLLSMLVGE